ncbi:hypothetical protein [Sporosarcina sp. Marseille-Q4943]|uniref:hypothetical protein n=1 Tax=Sporosarcina sp. Marseille-Q4943 TaxID=2942204 RepID=UPI00208DCBE6|nr:hypothetical protein [Sporosarcina sp. Marseille-Q4943]
MKRRTATPAGTANSFASKSEALGARAEDPGLSAAKEASEAVPAESVRPERKSTFFYKKTVDKCQNFRSCLQSRV